MKVAFFHSSKPRERVLADAFLSGARRHGHEVAAVELREGFEPDIDAFDVVAMVGVKSHNLFWSLRRTGVHVVMIDKGYARGNGIGAPKKWEFWRIAVDSHNPTRHLELHDYPDDRWRNLNIEVLPWRNVGRHIVLAGSSQKYHTFYGLKDPTSWARKIMGSMTEQTQREVVYRPKPSWTGAVPIKGTRFSFGTETLVDTLVDAWAVVTHGSNACFEAAVSGIPSIVLGDGVVKSISSTRIEEIREPRLATDRERQKVLNALAYHQYTAAEFADGTAWALIGREIHE